MRNCTRISGSSNGGALLKTNPIIHGIVELASHEAGGDLAKTHIPFTSIGYNLPVTNGSGIRDKLRAVTHYLGNRSLSHIINAGHHGKQIYNHLAASVPHAIGLTKELKNFISP